MAYAPRVKPKKRPPVGQAGNYSAPVDTMGMDQEMKDSLGFGPKAVKRPANQGMMGKLMDQIGGKRKKGK